MIPPMAVRSRQRVSNTSNSPKWLAASDAHDKEDTLLLAVASRRLDASLAGRTVVNPPHFLDEYAGRQKISDLATAVMARPV